MKSRFVGLLLSALVVFNLNAQSDSTIIEVSGIIISAENEDILPVPFTTVSVVGKGRGTYANYTGIFSIVAFKGEQLEFTAIGFETETWTIPLDMKGNTHSLVLAMKPSTVLLPTAVIFPWPDRDHLRLDFLAMKPNQAMIMEDIARENLSQEKLDEIESGMKVDGKEGGQYYLRQQAASLYYYGQRPPTPIFDPLAWMKFIKAIKNGDLKKKDK